MNRRNNTPQPMVSNKKDVGRNEKGEGVPAGFIGQRRLYVRAVKRNLDIRNFCLTDVSLPCKLLHLKGGADSVNTILVLDWKRQQPASTSGFVALPSRTAPIASL